MTRRPRRRVFRKDIEGLRAVAILAVVLYHAHVGAVPGGYVGVDVFFVISGYLITDHLWREVHDRRRLSFSTFYGRRIRRLLPASFLVLAVTAVASAAILPPLTARSVLKDGVACALYVGNYRFALLQTNYLTASAAPSPFQNYWSLGVEEQFYLIWPAVLLLASLAWRRRAGRHAGRRDRPPSRATAAAVLGVIAVASCAFSVWLTNASEPWAFFSLPTRAWELAVGGLIALGAPLIARMRGRPLLGWIGLGLVAWSVATFTSSTPFPGTAALVPVLGAAAIIAAGTGPRSAHGPVQILRTSPMQVVGRVSYSWYLWHWPMLILVPVALGHALSLAQNLSVAAISFVVATATFVLVERPVRLSSWLSTAPSRSLRLGAALTFAAVGACVLSVLSLPSLTGSGHAPVASAALRASTKAQVKAAAAADPVLSQLYQQTAAINAQVARSLAVQDVPANLEPSLPDADADEPPVFVDGCLDSYTDSSLRPCVFGDTTSSTTVVLFGDSHAAMWFPAVEQAAEKFGWRLITWTKATCPPFPLPIFSPELGSDLHRVRRLARRRPQPDRRHPSRARHSRRRPPLHRHLQLHSLQPRLALGPRAGGRRHPQPRRQVVVFGPVPKPPFDVPGCLSAHLTDATACTVPVDVGLNVPGMAAEMLAVTKSGGTYVDTQPWFCTLSTCAVMVDNLVVYRDDNHLTQAYASFLAPVVEPVLQRAIAGEPVVSVAATPLP